MKIKTSELIGTTLDWAVAKAKHETPLWNDSTNTPDFLPYSTNWSLAGSIIRKADIKRAIDPSGQWVAFWDSGYAGKTVTQYGRSELVAAMRCYVALELGGEVDVPEELL